MASFTSLPKPRSRRQGTLHASASAPRMLRRLTARQIMKLSAKNISCSNSGKPEARYGAAWRLFDFDLPEAKSPDKTATFGFRLSRKKSPRSPPPRRSLLPSHQSLPARSRRARELLHLAQAGGSSGSARKWPVFDVEPVFSATRARRPRYWVTLNELLPANTHIEMLPNVVGRDIS